MLAPFEGWLARRRAVALLRRGHRGPGAGGDRPVSRTRRDVSRSRWCS